MAIYVRRGKVLRVIRAAKGKRLAVFNLPSLSRSYLPGTQVAKATRVPKDFRAALGRYGDALGQ